MPRSFPEVEKIRSRVKSKVAQARGRLSGQTKILSGQGLRNQRVGGGQVMNKARSKVDQVMRKVKERRPNFISQVKEFKPGERIRRAMPKGGSRRVRGDLTSLPVPTRSGKGLSIADEPGKPYNGREIIIEM